MGFNPDYLIGFMRMTLLVAGRHLFEKYKFHGNPGKPVLSFYSSYLSEIENTEKTAHYPIQYLSDQMLRCMEETEDAAQIYFR